MTAPQESKPASVFGWLAFACAVCVFVGSALMPHVSSRVVTILGLAIVLISAPFMFLPFFFLKRDGQVLKDKPYYETTSLVSSGPYRLVRHPQYFGYSMLVVGLALISFDPPTLVMAMSGALFFYLQARAEEKHCLSLLGNSYREYMKRVPRFNVVLGLLRLMLNRRRAR